MISLIKNGESHRDQLLDLYFVLCTLPPYRTSSTLMAYPPWFNADDTQLYLTFKPEHRDRAVKTMEKCVESVKSWAVHNKLVLNDRKCNLYLYNIYSSRTLRILAEGVCAGNLSPLLFLFSWPFLFIYFVLKYCWMLYIVLILILLL